MARTIRTARPFRSARNYANVARAMKRNNARKARQAARLDLIDRLADLAAEPLAADLAPVLVTRFLVFRHGQQYADLAGIDTTDMDPREVWNLAGHVEAAPSQMDVFDVADGSALRFYEKREMWDSYDAEVASAEAQLAAMREREAVERGDRSVLSAWLANP
jgi:hypothetical protein